MTRFTPRTLQTYSSIGDVQRLKNQVFKKSPIQQVWGFSWIWGFIWFIVGFLDQHC